ncbi:ABC transporter ATP-binding protein [Oscillochloris sp. ZM17-4]|uniref:ABC transporter ATP-binding protein n=1 Tax=Oscillochloris sp. ZM17-4 TaxID=2866714 RepID=UPI001C72B6CE|nr:ABC transporter ATP-binding protein [Oscillochloris sp. ZM17-4]MBX0326492.1 ABC transporter ATP-binding protein [Oscillochloris sp. ZM17-4]
MVNVHDAPPLEVDGLVKRYGRALAVDGLSFRVSAGEIVGLVGPNGAGKTTVMRCCVGILRPSAGSVRVGGHDSVAAPSEARRQMAFVPELPSLYPLLTVAEQIEFIARSYGPLAADFAERREALLRRFDLWPQRAKLTDSLSKGMRQKTALVAAFLHGARVILLDEPLIGVDPAGIRQLKDLLLEARAGGAAIVVSTHLLDTAERLCDRILVLQAGRKRAEGSLADLRAAAEGFGDATLEEVFMELTKE